MRLGLDARPVRRGLYFLRPSAPAREQGHPVVAALVEIDKRNTAGERIGRVWARSGSVLVFGRRQRRDVPLAELAGVQKAPRHEVAGSWAPAKQWAPACRGTEDSAVCISAGA